MSSTTNTGDSARQQTLGILGGGQLGRMMVEAANRLGVKVLILDAENNPATDLCATTPGHVVGNFRDPASIDVLAQRCDVLTVEIEHVDADALEEAGRKHACQVHPSADLVRVIQDKFVQKCRLEESNIPLAPYVDLEPGSEAEGIRAAAFGFPVMLKTKTMAYDGRGNRVVKTEADVADAVASLGGGAVKGGPAVYLEKMVPFVKEVAVMVARSRDGEIVSYPCVETIQKDNICHVAIAPARIDGDIQRRARKIAEDAIAGLKGVGIFGVEMFLLDSGELLLNEIAPRPHNSGHYATEACHTSQFEQHLRCVLGLPLGSPDLKVPVAGMVNVLGVAQGMEATLAPCTRSLAVPGATVHMYGKKESRAGRKMGHITVVAQTMRSLLDRLDTILSDPTSSLSDRPVGTPSKLHQTPEVGIIMGSDSDLPTLKAAAEILTRFKVTFEVTIVSAHRTPDRLVAYARTAHARGLKVVIAAAGGAAHLPGMVAAITPLPVIGVPVALKVLDGMDSLLSIVQMPRGVPVATVAINNSTNAALLAVRILGAGVPEYRDRMAAYLKEQEGEVLGKVDRLESVGWEKY
ncbi:phosphoribosylaminoimidazole carboxylase ade2 [Thoreauomyces humboldtii]|nr:phosphoribosylaminoimidazole carboxylase ade2 [Thoreauomyces humboldtii]